MLYKSVLAALLLLAAGCDKMACVRHSDCPLHMLCGDEGMCVPAPDLAKSGDDGGADLGGEIASESPSEDGSVAVDSATDCGYESPVDAGSAGEAGMSIQQVVFRGYLTTSKD